MLHPFGQHTINPDGSDECCIAFAAQSVRTEEGLLVHCPLRVGDAWRIVTIAKIVGGLWFENWRERILYRSKS